MYKMSLKEYFERKKVNFIEGYSQQIPQQVTDLKNLVKNATNILEIGFNGGHSSEIFLENSLANVTSFDLGEHHYVLDGKRFIDSKYPGRHTLILGDSHKTIPEFKTTSNTQFDFLFVDGDHSYDGALKDLMDCRDLALPNAVLVFDDVIYKKELEMSWTVGPTNAWNDMKSMNKIEELGYCEYSRGRGMVFGKYK
jgi:predicted O-methyltransferase YrrM